MDKEGITDNHYDIFSKLERHKQISRIFFIEKRLKCLEKLALWLSIGIIGQLLWTTINLFLK